MPRLSQRRTVYPIRIHVGKIVHYAVAWNVGAINVHAMTERYMFSLTTRQRGADERVVWWEETQATLEHKNIADRVGWVLTGNETLVKS